MNTTQEFNTKALAIAVMLAFAPAAWALPTGGAVSAGGATIATSAGTTTIGQTTQNVAINWQAFNIGAGEAVRFVQPSSSSVALNRVLGADPSSILGSLSANGKVFLINPNGILFGQGAQVNVGGLVASTLNVTDADFMAGTYRFSGTSVAGVMNRGSINADGGYVALLGANVSNEGVISARLGTVALASGSAMTLDMAGDGLLSVAISQGAANALAQNSGTIRADGGQVLLTAQAAGGLLQGVVNNTGVIQAQTIANHNGTIRLLGDMDTGVVNAGGTLDASAPNGGNGGFIETSAAHVNIASNVSITTAAPLGLTGTWLIDPVDFTVGSAPGDNITGAALSAQLVDSNITIATVAGPGAGNGDIFVTEAITWNGALGVSNVPTTLTLNALRSVNIGRNSAGLVIPTAAITPTNGSLIVNAGLDVNIDAAITTTLGNITVCCGRDINVREALTTNGGSVLLSAGQDINVIRSAANPNTALTVNDGNSQMCAARNINLDNQLNAGTTLMTQTRSTAIAGLTLGLPLGMTLNAGIGATGPGAAGGTLNVVNGGLAGTFITITGPGAPVTIRYNPTSYATPTNYALDFTGTGGPVTALMLVYPGGADKTFDGTNAAVFTTLQGLPAGVSLVAGPGSTATFDTPLAGVSKPITYSGFTLAGANAANFSLPVACCGNTVIRTVGNIVPAVLPAALPVVVVAAADLLPLIQNEPESEFPRAVPGLSLGLLEGGVRMPPVLVAVIPPPPPEVVVVPVVVPPPVPPQIYVPPVRVRKPDRN